MILIKISKVLNKWPIEKYYKMQGGHTLISKRYIILEQNKNTITLIYKLSELESNKKNVLKKYLFILKILSTKITIIKYKIIII